ncbi:MAG TPA: metallophosphatase, partial [Oceanospirillales bacterium]|nr:metallophosphatase [Oceanospirillales bacterium]
MFRPLYFSLLLLATAGAQADTTRIAFGSCIHQDKPAPILDAVVAR